MVRRLLKSLIISGAYLFFGLIIYKAMYGKVKNPHQSYEDRKIYIQTIIRQVLSIAIAVTLYAMLQISMKAYGLESFKAISCITLFPCDWVSLYAMASLRFYKL